MHKIDLGESKDIATESHGDKKNKYKLGVMIVLTGLFFIVELVVGIYTRSLALVSDAFHMLSDIVALSLGMYALIAKTKKPTIRETFGNNRLEIVVSLINASSLVALCSFIILEAIERFTDVEEIREPYVLLIVGGIGLLINLLGLALFHSGDSAHSHSHSHAHAEDVNGGHSHNIKAVMAHILADALGSIAVIISSCIIAFTDWEYRFYVDPALSLIVVVLILVNVIPVLRNSVYILLQHAPTFVDISKLLGDLGRINDILEMHHLHIYSQTPDIVVATIHVTLQNFGNFEEVSKQIKEIFHNHNIHNVTIQPETGNVANYLSQDTYNPDGDSCKLLCDNVCEKKKCC